MAWRARQDWLPLVHVNPGSLSNLCLWKSYFISRIFHKPEDKWTWLLRHLVEFLSAGSVLIFVTKKVCIDDFPNDEKVAYKLFLYFSCVIVKLQEKNMQFSWPLLVTAYFYGPMGRQIWHDRRKIRRRTNDLTCTPSDGGTITPTSTPMEKSNSTFLPDPTIESMTSSGPHVENSHLRPYDHQPKSHH